MIRTLAIGALALVVSVFAVTQINAQTSTVNPTQTPMPTTSDQPSGAPNTGFGYR